MAVLEEAVVECWGMITKAVGPVEEVGAVANVIDCAGCGVIVVIVVACIGVG